MSDPNIAKYTFRNSITSYETDAYGRISLANVFYYFQEAANHHASLLDWGLEYMDSVGKFWILSRLKLQIDTYPVHKEDVAIETWSRGAEGFFAYRDYRIVVNEKCYGNAVSSWMVLDKTTHRPCKIEQLGKPIPANNESYLLFPDVKISALANKHLLLEKRVHFSDIDINLHVNNGKYVEILLDAIPEKLMQSQKIKEIDIQYLHESRLGDILAVYADRNSFEDASEIVFSIENSTVGKETCRCRVKFGL